MNFYTDSFIFKLLSFFVRHLISSSLQKEELGIINSEENIIYALATESLIDLAAFNEICKQNNLPLPVENIQNTKLKRFICLQSPKYLISEQKFKRQKTHNLEELLKLDHEISIIPVSVSWGNRPDKKQSLFKIIFSPSWRPAGSLKKIFKLVVHGRNLKLQFERTFYVKEEIEQKNGIKKKCFNSEQIS